MIFRATLFCSAFCHVNREMCKGEQMESSLHACNWYQSPTAHQREQSLRGKGRGGGGEEFFRIWKSVPEVLSTRPRDVHSFSQYGNRKMFLISISGSIEQTKKTPVMYT